MFYVYFPPASIEKKAGNLTGDYKLRDSINAVHSVRRIPLEHELITVFAQWVKFRFIGNYDLSILVSWILCSKSVLNSKNEPVW